jgi:FKBP-type peptidyl-prolyl cis-trans isomerase FkpA
MRNLIIIALLTSACSGATVPDITDTTFATALGVDLSASALLSNGEYVRDLTIGTGAALQQGQTLSMTYSVFLTDGTAVETNVGGTNYTFVLGAGTVISGIDQGLGAMNVGGTRQLIIPPALAYGDQGAGGGVIPSEAIVVAFVQITAAQ